MSDEKLFTVQATFNPQNERCLVKEGSIGPLQAKTVFRTQKPASVMVWGAVTSSGKTPLVFVDPGVKINTKECVETILKKGLLPWANSHFNHKP